MELLILIIGVVLVAIPIAVIYLLVKVSSQQRLINILGVRVAELARRQPHTSDAVESQVAQSRADQSEAVDSLKTRSQNLLEEARKELPEKPAATDSESQQTPKTSPMPPQVPRQGQAGYQQPATATASNAAPAQTSITPAVARKPVKTEPDIGDKIGQYIKDYFTEGNLIVRVGIIVLFFGVAFLLKYAADNSFFPPELRLAGVALGGLVLLVIGWRLRSKRRVYALVMQGGGVGVLYLTVYAALRLFDLLPPVVVIVVMLLMVSLAAALAVLQNAKSLAVLAAVGGFLAPILTSTGEGSHIVLFSYYLILNIGILFIAWFKSWRMLNLIGFAFTFVIGTAWGVLRYRPEQFFSTEAFLVAFFLFYVALAILYARRQPPHLRGLVDGTLIFGTPLIVFTLQAGLVHQYEYGMSWSALVAGGLYLLLAFQCWKFGGQNYRLLSEAFLALGVIFASLTIPFALDGNGIAAAWALEGAGILWISVRQQQRLASQRLGIAFGIFLQFAGGIALLAEHTLKGASQPVFNSVFLGAVMVAVAGLFSSYYLLRQYRESRSWEYQASVPLLLWGLCWWFGNGVTEINRYHMHIPWLNELTAILGFIAISVAILGVLERKLDWRILRYAVIGLTVVMAFLVLESFSVHHPAAYGGVLIWPLAFAVLYGLLRQRDSLDAESPPAWLNYLHTIGALLMVTLLTAELAWLIGDFWNLDGGWYSIAFAIPALMAIAAVLKLNIWPLKAHQKSYLYWSVGLLLMFLFAWSVITNINSTGQALPLPYLPLLNPIDIVQVMVLTAMLAWWQRLRSHSLAQSLFQSSPSLQRGYLIAVAALVFVWLNAMLLRSLHHWFDVPFSFDGFYDSALVQACLSIFWTLLGLSVMVIASKRGWRGIWIAAAALLGVVVVKLFSVDLADSNTLESIFSFIVVGVLLLVIGYYSPIPPGKVSEQASEKLAEKSRAEKTGDES